MMKIGIILIGINFVDIGIQSATALDQLDVGRLALISEIRADHRLVRRLLSLGIRVGSTVRVTQQRDKGVVVACNGNRVALGGAIASRLLTRPLDLSDISQ